MLSESFGGRTKHLGWNLNPAHPQTLHFVQGDNRETLLRYGPVCRSYFGVGLVKPLWAASIIVMRLLADLKSVLGLVTPGKTWPNAHPVKAFLNAVYGPWSAMADAGLGRPGG